MIRFLIKGLLRDRQRSTLPLIVVGTGVMLTVAMHAWVTGVIGDSLEFNAKLETGHVKVVTRGYADNIGQMPIDLALDNAGELLDTLRGEFPMVNWVERSRFSGLIDVPDENGETVAQGPTLCIAINLLDPDSQEKDRMNLTHSLVRGHFPQEPGEILLSDELFTHLGLEPGQEVTLITSDIYGSMAFRNYRVSGTLAFGARGMDKGTVIMDNRDASAVLDMDNGAGEILGFLKSGYYDREETEAITKAFNARHPDTGNEFAPVMLSMREQGSLASLIDMSEILTLVISSVFILVMSIVLWNTGLISGLRRYGEVGVRLAIGEEKGHVYRSMLTESVAIGIAGSVLGTLVGLGLAYLVQTHGIQFGDIMDDSAVLMPTTFRAHITPPAFYVGFIPGVLSTFLGAALAGIGIYKRKTAQLFKELE